jgi:hypothetical protein
MAPRTRVRLDSNRWFRPRFISPPPRPVAVAVGATVVETLGTGSTRREEDRRRKEQVSLVPMFGLLQIVAVCVSSSASIYIYIYASSGELIKIAAHCAALQDCVCAHYSQSAVSTCAYGETATDRAIQLSCHGGGPSTGVPVPPHRRGAHHLLPHPQDLRLRLHHTSHRRRGPQQVRAMGPPK